MRVYLDNAATTPLYPEVIAAMLPYLEQHFGNPSAIHAHGRECKAAVEKARKTIAQCLNCTPGEIFFTSGGTEANNMALRCTIKSQGIRHLITTPIEHHCVQHTAAELEREGLVTLHVLHVDSLGRIDIRQLEQLLQTLPAPVLVSVMHANNEIGTIADLQAIGNLVKQYAGIFHSDTVQTVGHLPLDLKTLPVHLIAGSAHKFHGPKGVGFIYVRHDLRIPPLLFGGGQERNMRAGTENVPGIMGMARALELSCSRMQEQIEYVTRLRQQMAQRLQTDFADVRINGDPEHVLYTILNVSFPLTDQTQLLLFNLDLNGISASSGSACSSGAEKGSHVLEAVGGHDQRVAIRFSFSSMNTSQEIDYVADTLQRLVPQPAAI
ncbi:MAG: cysteine desulfurase family protein [Chitinophagales bacterium]|nr:cysteine desulfurase [Chitinophagales bacterium]MDW8393198.1 cysteine desulfurase family protein [Chitinophagales bacterium]